MFQLVAALAAVVVLSGCVAMWLYQTLTAPTSPGKAASGSPRHVARRRRGRLFSCDVKVYCQEVNKAVVEAMPTVHRPYCYPLWASNGHVQTLFASALRSGPDLFWKRDVIRAADGGSVAVDWLIRDAAVGRRFPPHSDCGGAPPGPLPDDLPRDAPTVLVAPGTCSTSASYYIQNFSAVCNARGWRVAVFCPRGCGTLPLTSPLLFRYAPIADFDLCVQYARHHTPRGAPLLATGFSLGANLLIKYLGEQSIQGRQPIDAAISISQGYDGVETMRQVQASSFYRGVLLSKIKGLLKTHAQWFKDEHDLGSIQKIRTFDEFDRRFSLPVNGEHFERLEDYWHQSSCKDALPHIAVPTLLINALDDPLLVHSVLPYEEVQRTNPNLVLVLTDKGGHLGFAEGLFLPGPITWADRLSSEFLAAVLEHRIEAEPVSTVPLTEAEADMQSRARLRKLSSSSSSSASASPPASPAAAGLRKSRSRSPSRASSIARSSSKSPSRRQRRGV